MQQVCQGSHLGSKVPQSSAPPPFPGAAVEVRNSFQDTQGKNPPHWGHFREYLEQSSEGVSEGVSEVVGEDPI